MNEFDKTTAKLQNCKNVDSVISMSAGLLAITTNMEMFAVALRVKRGFHPTQRMQRTERN